MSDHGICCCTRAAIGHSATPSSAMNSRCRIDILVAHSHSSNRGLGRFWNHTGLPILAAPAEGGPVAAGRAIGLLAGPTLGPLEISVFSATRTHTRAAVASHSPHRDTELRNRVAHAEIITVLDAVPNVQRPSATKQLPPIDRLTNLANLSKRLIPAGQRI